MFCPSCGQKTDDGTVFCPNCGANQAQAAVQSPGQQAPVAPASPMPYPPPPPQPYGSVTYPPVKQRKRHGCLIAFIIFLVILLLAAAALYFFVPGLLRPNDLGIRPSRDAYMSALTKLGIRKDESPKTGEAEDYTITYGPPQDADASLTSEELTSFFNENRPPYYAVKNVQVRINDDGTIEASGRLDTSYVFDIIMGGQYSKEDAQEAMPMVGLIPRNINVYFKFSGSVEDNQVEGLDVEAVKIMGISLPDSIIGSADDFVTEILNVYISTECQRVGAYVEHFGVSDGQADFTGILPSSVDRIPVG